MVSQLDGEGGRELGRVNGKEGMVDGESKKGIRESQKEGGMGELRKEGI